MLYDEILKRVNFYYIPSGAYIDKEDRNRSALKRFLVRRFYCFNLFSTITHLIAEFLWLVNAIKISEKIVKITYTIPSLTLCLLGVAKSYYLVKNGDLVNDLINSVKSLQAASAKIGTKAEIEKETKKRTVILNMIYNINNTAYTFGLMVFAVGPVILSWLMYRSTGKLVMQLPFFSVFPFDATDIRFWPFAYIHQVWTGMQYLFYYKVTVR